MLGPFQIRHEPYRTTLAPAYYSESTSIMQNSWTSATSTTTEEQWTSTTTLISNLLKSISDENKIKVETLENEEETTSSTTTIVMNTSTTTEDEFFASQPFEAIVNGTNIELSLELGIMLNTTEEDVECIPNPTNEFDWQAFVKSANATRVCHQNTSIYVPKPLSLVNSYYFGYPILQTISCYGSKLELRCPKNQHLHVYAAYYGNQMNTNYCNNDLDVICFRSASYEYLIDTCQNQTFCNLLVTERVFGNPCLDLVSNQIMVQYQCLDSEAYKVK